MTESDDNSQWTVDNFTASMQRIARMTAGPMPDVRPVDFEYRTSEHIVFMSAYIGNLIARIEVLERQLAERS